MSRIPTAWTRISAALLTTANEGSGLYSSSPLFPPNVIAASDSENIDRTFPGCLTGSWIEFLTLLAPAVPQDVPAFTIQEDVT